MLVLKRKIGAFVVCDLRQLICEVAAKTSDGKSVEEIQEECGHSIRFTITGIKKGGQATLGVDAPSIINVYREELGRND